jgi:hypothetical protein
MTIIRTNRPMIARTKYRSILSHLLVYSRRRHSEHNDEMSKVAANRKIFFKMRNIGLKAGWQSSS